MQIEKNRHLVLLDVLIGNCDRYVTSEELAASSMSSVRTVKNDITELNAMLKAEGCAFIDSRKAYGYRLVPKDENEFQRLCETVRVYRILYYDRPIDATNRRLYILQTLLSVPFSLIDDLADCFYVSRSLLAKDIVYVKDFLSSYDLKVISIPYKGMSVTGPEQHIRSAMIEVYSSQYHEIESAYLSEPFNGFFLMDDYDALRHALLKVIRESEISVSDAGSKKLATYLCLIPERRKAGYFIDEDVLNESLRNTYEYRLAEEIFNNPIFGRYTCSDEKEIMNFARMIIICRDVDMRFENDRNNLSSDLIEQSRNILETFRNTYGSHYYAFLSSEHLDSVLPDLQSVLIRILLQKKYDAPYRRRLYTYTETGENHYSPMAMEAARIFIEFLQKELHTVIRGADIRSLASIFAFAIRSFPLVYQKRRLAVFSMEGRSVSEQMKQSLLARYSSCIEKIDVFNLYEMRRIDFKDYDAAVSSWDVAYYRYPVPLVIDSGINRQEDRRHLFEELIMPGLERSLIEKLKKIFAFHTDVPVSTYSQLIDLVAGKYAQDENHHQEMVKKAVSRYSALSYYNPDSGISMIFLDWNDTKKEILEVYQPEGTVFWGINLEILYFIVVCIRPNTDVSDIRMFSQMIHMLFMDSSIVAKMKESADDVLDQLWISAAESLL